MGRQSKYSQEFRDTAFELATKGEKSVAQIAKELGIDKHTLYSWMKSSTTNKARQTETTGKTDKKQMSAEEELKELRRKNKQLEQEVEILKKAAAYFAKTLL